jgi:nucleotide-binding universal stress UspA family protein
MKISNDFSFQKIDTMKKIIVPVDFSKVAEAGLLFARSMAGFFHYKLKIVHVYGRELNVMEKLALQSGDTPYNYLLNKLKTFVEESEKNGDVLTKTRIEFEILEGDAVKKIVELSQEPDTAMIIAGTEGRYNWLEQLTGSITSALAQKAKCPVLLVPNGVKYKKPENMLYASDFSSADEKLIKKFIDFARLFSASVHFIHIEENDEIEFSAIEDSIFNLIFKDGDPDFSFNMVSINGVNVIDGLNQYAEENEIDLIVLVNRHRAFIDNLLGLSTTRQLAMDTNFPLMVYHFQE